MKIVAALPLRIRAEGRYETRDVGLLISALCELGIDAKLVLIKGHQEITPRYPWIVPASEEQWKDPGFWRSLEADAMIFNGWAATRFEIERAAMLEACPLLIEKLDTDGVKSPHIWFGHALRQASVAWFKTGNPLVDLYRRGRTLVYAFLRITFLWLFPSLLYRRMALAMAKVPFHAAETPLACARVERFVTMFGEGADTKVIHLPHPANDQILSYDRGIPKENVIIAVGRWFHHGKDGKTLLKAADLFLETHPHWSLVVVGAGEEILRGRWQKMRAKGQVSFAGSLSHADLKDQYCRAKIILVTSHSETFHIASAEALCCGCSVVGPARIPSMSWFASAGSGTTTYRRNPIGFFDALNAEAGEWERGERDPETISTYWRQKVGSQAVAEKLLKVVESATGPNGKRG
jgi:glycosyltransferase involved in cell wall biosynthesis